MSNKQITCVVVEDEVASKQTLLNYLAKYCPNVKVLAEADNAIEAEKIIRIHQPDFVFLDIEMPFGNAFDIIEKFNPIHFQIIFITAFSNYALQAIHLSACSYLLKPLNINDLEDAVSKVTQQIKQKNTLKTAQILLDNLAIENNQLKKIVLPLLDGFEVIVLKDIVRCEANDNLTDFYLQNGKKITVCSTLKHFEQTLSDFNFFRCHKSQLININCIKSYKKGKGGEIILHNLVSVPLSPNRKEDFYAALGL